MKMESLLGIMLSLSILQSCQNDETNGIQNEVNKNGITFMSLIDDTNNSRAYDTSWVPKTEHTHPLRTLNPPTIIAK
jgi:hypothetical protein